MRSWNLPELFPRAHGVHKRCSPSELGRLKYNGAWVNIDVFERQVSTKPWESPEASESCNINFGIDTSHVYDSKIHMSMTVGDAASSLHSGRGSRMLWLCRKAGQDSLCVKGGCTISRDPFIAARIKRHALISRGRYRGRYIR